MNEYTRREEIRWTLATVFILVPAVAIAIVRLVLAQGPMVTNPDAIKREVEANQRKADYVVCTKAATKLTDELVLFKTRAGQSKKKAEAEAKKARRGRKSDKPVSYVIPWSAAAPVLKQVKALHKAKCRAATEAAAALDDKVTPVWTAVKSAAKIKDPGSIKKDQRKAAKELLALFDKPLAEKLKAQVEVAAKRLDETAKKTSKARETDLVRDPLPEGLFPRGAAIGVGVGVSLAALIISYISVRSASLRRGRTLVSLRRFANTPEAGLQAASIVRLAAHHNGGEPGMVVGSALGGLLAALLSPTANANVFIADLFVAGSMGGLLIGLAAQWLVRTLTGVNRWRERTKELGEIEKPTIPVALVLGGVTPGLEKQFLRYFEALPVGDAATVVQKLAAQAEEQILAAADAAAQQQAGAGAWPSG